MCLSKSYPVFNFNHYIPMLLKLYSTLQQTFIFFNYLLKFYLIIVIFKNNKISFVILISSNEMRCMNEVFELATQMFNHYIPNCKQFIISIFHNYTC